MILSAANLIRAVKRAVCLALLASIHRIKGRRENGVKENPFMQHSIAYQYQ